MNKILDYDALFNERGEQANVCTDAYMDAYVDGHADGHADARKGGEYAPGREERMSRDSGHRQSARTVVSERVTPQAVAPDYSYPIRLRPTRYVDFDTFEKPERSQAEARECLQKTAILFASIITIIVAIAILL